MHYILYEHDHENRATALANRMPIYQLVTDPVKVVPDITTLIFWGHGTAGGLCGMSPHDAAKKVKAWKASNKKIKTVEILTCNARHSATGTDPFIAQFRRKLGFQLRRSLKVKCLPIRMGPGGIHGDSILFADYMTKTWCYVTTPNESSLHFIRNIFKHVCENEYGDDAIKTAVFLTSPPPKALVTGPAKNPFPRLVNSIREMHDSPTIHAYSSQAPFMRDFANALKDNAFRTEFLRTRKYSMNYGDFNHLRDQLVAIN